MKSRVELVDSRLDVLRDVAEAGATRTDALNRFLDGPYQAIVQRLVHDERYHAVIKTVTTAHSRE